MLDSQELQLRAAVEVQKAALSLAKTNLGYTKIVAPEDGIVSERLVRPGQLVSPGTQVISLVQSDVWVQANFLENQIRGIQRGDVAEIRVDAIPGVLLRGKVEEVAPASGSQFALLPPDNATGNFTKIAQRIPVKIVLDRDQSTDARLRPGLSVDSPCPHERLSFMTAAIQPKTKLATNPYIGIVGVFLGATLATMNARLVSVGLPDLRGALGLGFDQASWLPTALNMATMFSGCFVVFLSALFGPRRILIPASLVFALSSALLPFAHGYGGMVALMVIAGLSSGTFYSLTMTFVLNCASQETHHFRCRGLCGRHCFHGERRPGSRKLVHHAPVVALDLLELRGSGAFNDSLRLLWNSSGGLYRNCGPSWRGFTYFSVGLSLIYGALDQGERLYWLHSGIIVGMLSAGIILILASLLRRLEQPLPVLDLEFLSRRNIIVIGLSIFVFKFAQLATLVLVPSFLENIHDYRPLQVGDALAWVALPMFATVWLVAIVVIFTNSRLVLALGLTLAAVVCWHYSRIDTSWSGNSFEFWELLLSVGFACSYVGLVSSLVLEAIQGGAMTSLAKAATISGFAHFIRLFGGEVGVAYHDAFLVGTRKVSLQSAGPERPERHMDNGPASSNARRRRLWKVDRNGRSTISRGRSPGVTSSGAGVYPCNLGRIHFDRMDGRYLPHDDASTAAHRNLLPGLEANAMTCAILRRLVTLILLSITTATLYGADVRKLSLKEAVELAISQNHSLRIARLKIVENEQKKAGEHASYFPSIKDAANAGDSTGVDHLVIPAGTFGRVQGQLVPGNAGQHSSGSAPPAAQ